MPDLTEAMGINRPSLYAAFGNKEELFRKALDRYAEGPASFVRQALDEPTARKVAEALLYGEIELLCDPKTPRGCFAVQAALACGDEAECGPRRIVRPPQVARTPRSAERFSGRRYLKAICPKRPTPWPSRRTPCSSSTAWPCKPPAGAMRNILSASRKSRSRSGPVESVRRAPHLPPAWSVLRPNAC